MSGGLGVVRSTPGSGTIRVYPPAAALPGIRAHTVAGLAAGLPHSG
jgi:hypothetical protein